jgi:hypothetical protein
LRYPESMPQISPTAEGFRTVFRQPLLTIGEITWRWVVGATTVALFFYGLFEYLGTLPVNGGELLFLRSRQPYLMAKAIAHILRGSLSRVVVSATLAAMLLALLWMIAGALGRIATVRALVDHFRDYVTRITGGKTDASERDLAGDATTVSDGAAFPALLRLNFLRTCLTISAVLGFIGAAILAGFASPASHPAPGLAFMLFIPLAALVALLSWALNWLLSLAAMFAVREEKDVIGAISAAVALCRRRTGAVAAVSTWTGLAHLVAFVGATTVISMPLGFAPILPGRVILLAMIFVTLGYFALADWLYMARLAGYVCIAEMPEALWMPPPVLIPRFSPSVQSTPTPPEPATIDRNELILSDVPNSPTLQTAIDRDEPILSDAPNTATGSPLAEPPSHDS